jgi:hypothetical protein
LPKVTYLFGAGASCKCLPIILEMPARLEEFRQYMDKNQTQSSEPIFHGSNQSLSAIEELFQNQCTDLIENITNHSSIDTYAKKLFITKQDQPYLFLKAILTIFFIHTQLTKQPDIRYDSFFASILKNNATEFTDEIRIISWNYDFQFEMAYSKYSLNEDFRHNQLALTICPDGIHPSDYKDRFSIFKINGTTAVFDNKSKGIVNLFTRLGINNDTAAFRKELLYFFLLLSTNSKYTSMLKFAWERQDTVDEDGLFNVTYEAIKGGEILVVIGYSFPFFNRQIDRNILSSIGNGNPIKIYVQDIKPQSIIDKLDSVLPLHFGSHKVIPIPSVDQFFLPHEL